MLNVIPRKYSIRQSHFDGLVVSFLEQHFVVDGNPDKQRKGHHIPKKSVQDICIGAQINNLSVFNVSEMIS